MRGFSSERARWLAQNIVPHERALRSWLSRRAFDIDIDDIIQEMYARIAALESVEQVRNPRQYATQTAFSILVNHLRRSRIVPMTTFGDLEELGLASSEPSPEARLTFRDELRELEVVLQTLPERCRQAFIMRRAYGLSQKEVAQRLECSEKTVEKYMADGVRLLIEVYRRGGKNTAQLSKDVQERPAQSGPAADRK